MKKFLIAFVAFFGICAHAFAACPGAGGCFWVGGTGTWDNAATTHWSASSGGANGAGPPDSASPVTFDGSSGGGTVTVASIINASNTIVSITAGAFTGTLDFSANNPSISLATISFSGAGTRTINCGSGTFTITGSTGTIFDNFTITGETFSCASGTLAFTASATGTRTFNTGQKTYGTITVTNSGSTPATFLPAGGNFTFTNFTINAPNIVQINSGNILTITNAFNFAGTGYNNLVMVETSSANGFTATIAAGAASTLNWCVLAGIIFTTSSVTATNCFDLKGNSGVTITGPSGGGRIIGG